ncbi:hypothetical protein BaRGS_00012954 [Batillaria attramentaria]|uniref:26S proteasome non-ATPase regulatory subunit 5 n=1 Tax=Batillaria attramentaria TaxID=370345 RepID=A0ABD0L845_9CAEN
MAASTVASLVESLEGSEDRLDCLEQLKTLLSSVPPAELRNIVPNISILPVFACLNTDDKAQQEVCCEVLDRLLTALSAGLILENLYEEFTRWLQDGSDHVQQLCLSQLVRVSQDTPDLLARSVDLLVGVAEQLGNESQQIARTATTVLVNLGSTAAGLEAVYSGPVFERLQNVMSKSDTVRYRVFQMAVELSIASPEALEVSHRSGILVKLVNEIHKDDILLQLNCLELLVDLAQSNHGLTYLDQQGIVKKLEEMMATADSSPFGAYLLPGLLKFFGGLARFHPKEVLNHFQVFVGMVFAAVGGEGDASIRGLAIDTIGFIATTPEGKAALNKQGNMMTECVKNLGGIIRNSPSEMRVRALEAVASLIKLQVSDQTEELQQITESWFTRLCTNPFDVIWSIAKQPFTDLRTAALKVLLSLAYLPWGQQLMNNAAGFKEYLLDRAIESTKEGKEAKFEVVKALAESPTVTQIFGNPYYVQLRDFCREGPFFIRAQAEVAFEEET